jgi:nucleotide-binding universal stress UspA family protein
MQARVPKQLGAHAVVCIGDAADEIAAAAVQQDADFIVMSTHGHTGWRRLVYGSVAEKVLRLADCPVLVVRAGERSGKAVADSATITKRGDVQHDTESVLL